MDPVFEIEVQALVQILDELDYFQILKVDPRAPVAELRAAYYRESRQYHPDQFFGLPDGDLKRGVERIYRRVNEAWVCLRDDARRVKYAADVAGPDRAKKLRFTESSEAEQKQAREQQLGATPHARKVFQQGLADLAAGRHAQALQSFKMALGFEPQNALFREKHDEAARLAGARK